MYSAAISRPGDGVPRPCKASDAKKETSAFRLLAVSREAICRAAGDNCAKAQPAPKKPAATVRKPLRDMWLHHSPAIAPLRSVLCRRCYTRLMMPRQVLAPQRHGTVSISLA